MQVVEKHGKEFREADVILAFTSMSKWKDSAGNSDVLHSKSFQTLVGTIHSDSQSNSTSPAKQCKPNRCYGLHEVVKCCAQIWSLWG